MDNNIDRPLRISDSDSNNYIPPQIKLSAHLVKMHDIEGLNLLQECIEEQNIACQQPTDNRIDRDISHDEKIVDKVLDRNIK